MSGFRGKRKEEGEYASEGDSEGHAPPKKRTFKKDSSDDSTDDIVVCEISKNRRVTVRSWQGKVVVDIREFYVKDGNTLPGKKLDSGIGNCVYPRNFISGIPREKSNGLCEGKKDQTVALLTAIEEDNSREVKGVCSISRGISLTMDQWNVLRDHVEEIEKAVNENT
ncbi:hypothetical protein SLA2020_285400 [Shorea laevis]